MKLQKGKRYVRRDGGITGPLKTEIHTSENWPFHDPYSNKDYTEDGYYWSEGDECDLDLVSEYIPTSGNG